MFGQTSNESLISKRLQNSYINLCITWRRALLKFIKIQNEVFGKLNDEISRILDIGAVNNEIRYFKVYVLCSLNFLSGISYTFGL